MMNKKKTFGATESDRRRLFKLVSDRFFRHIIENKFIVDEIISNSLFVGEEYLN